MTEYVVDINAKYVPEDRSAWRMFPGERYRFLDSFLKNGLVFLELPGLELPNEAVTAETPLLTERLHAARAVEAWIHEYRRYSRSSMTDEPPEQPTRDLSAYAGMTLSRNQHNVLGAVRSLFGVAKKGDLVVVPDKIPLRQVIIGEFLDGPESRINHSEPEHFLGEGTPARQVRWFPAVDELRMPRGLSDILRIPPAISRVPKQFDSSVLENSYGTFYRAQEYSSRVIIRGRQFDTQDTFDFGAFAKFASVICSMSGGSDDEFRSVLGNYAERLVGADYQPTVSLNINSPGTGSLKAATFVPIFFSAFFALLATADAATLPKAADVHVVNSAEGAADPCAAQVNETVRDTLKLMGYDQWKAQCERVKRLQGKAQVNVDSRVRGGK